jgi:hypothetical protein
VQAPDNPRLAHKRQRATPDPTETPSYSTVGYYPESHNGSHDYCSLEKIIGRLKNAAESNLLELDGMARLPARSPLDARQRRHATARHTHRACRLGRSGLLGDKVAFVL